MTNPTQPKPNPLPAILVYGTPTNPARSASVSNSITENFSSFAAAFDGFLVFCPEPGGLSQRGRERVRVLFCHEFCG